MDQWRDRGRDGVIQSADPGWASSSRAGATGPGGGFSAAPSPLRGSVSGEGENHWRLNQCWPNTSKAGNLSLTVEIVYHQVWFTTGKLPTHHYQVWQQELKQYSVLYSFQSILKSIPKVLKFRGKFFCLCLIASQHPRGEPHTHNGFTDFCGDQLIFPRHKNPLCDVLTTYQRHCSRRLDTRPGCSGVHVVEESVNLPQRNTPSSVTHLRWERIKPMTEAQAQQNTDAHDVPVNCWLKSSAFQNEYQAIQVANGKPFPQCWTFTPLVCSILRPNELHCNINPVL